MAALWRSLAPCGPVLDAAAADRTLDILAEVAADEAWAEALKSARPALAPVFSASPYLAGLARRDPARVGATLLGEPDERLAALLTQTADGGGGFETEPVAAVLSDLRNLKAKVHLLTALADLGGVWGLETATGALSRFADAALSRAMALAAGEALAAGRVTRTGEGPEGPLPGLFCIAMGKLGAFELNYSSDIDISFFYEPDALPLAAGVEPGRFANRFVERVAAMLQTRDEAGYVFRVDMRLRPDPASTPVAVPLPLAYRYYESVGQNWERAAFIKARLAGGDAAQGRAFLDALTPFIWRRSLDFAAIADIHSIKRQIHVHKVDERLAAKGADLKLGRGGIREIEFYVQTQQLILGGRQPDLRAAGTVEALFALSRSGHVAPETAEALASAYRTLRGLEHRVQMVGDEQTHRLPESDPDRRRVATLAGFENLRGFDAAVTRTLKAVNRCYGDLFAGEEKLSSRFGSLIFTGVDDDPETLRTVARMGFSDPAAVSGVIRGWRHGRIAATRSERGRELFTRLAPRLLEAARATGAADAAFARFADFLPALSNGVQVQSLFLAQPKLFELVLRIMASAPRFARTLARRPAALDALLDPGFFAALGSPDALSWEVGATGGFEAAMDRARRTFRERSFRIAVHILDGLADAATAGRAFADLADALIADLARAAMDEVERTAGAFDGEAAVVALGKCGSREMTATSDLDLMTVYRANVPAASSALKGWSAETFHARFTQRLVTALAAPTAEGELYEVDMRLRPSGAAGPVAVSLAAFEAYYREEAEVWEFLAMTRARVVWASSPAFGAAASAAIEAALRQRRDAAATLRAVAKMRALMARERPPEGFWDMKLGAGGLIDIEFCAQCLQLLHAASGGPLRQNTADALAALQAGEFAPSDQIQIVMDAWRLQQTLTQLLNIAVDDNADPTAERAGFRALLTRAAGVRGLTELKAALRRSRRSAHGVFQSLISEPARRPRPASG